jgi:phage-related protein
MATPGGLGDAWIDVHANTDPFNREVDKGLQKGLETASKDADQILEHMGSDFGKKLASSTEKELGKHGGELAHAVEESTANVPFEFRGTPRKYNRDKLGRFAKAVVGDLEREVERAFSGSDSQGFFGRIGNLFSKGIQDAIGSIGGTPSGSPVALITGPAIASLVALIIGAIQAVNGLLGVLALLPALLASIGVQAGALFLAFRGVGTAISGAFAAKNATELQEAIKNLTPEAQNFVKSLLPLRDIFKSISDAAQSSFFRALGTTVTLVATTLGPLLRGGFSEVASSLGYFFFQLGHFFASPAFVDFVYKVFPLTARWITTFGPTFIRILGALIGIADASLPYLAKFGDFITNNLNFVASLLEGTVKDKSFQQWLANSLITVAKLFDVIGQAFEFIVVLLAQLDRAGGNLILDQISESLSRLTTYLASPAGQKSLEALINLSVILLQLFTGLIGAFLLVLAGMETLGEKIEAFWHWLTGTGKDVQKEFKHITGVISDSFAAIPDKILAVFSNFGSLLFNAGRNLIQGLLNGINSMIAPLRHAFNYITNLIPSWKGPEDKDRKLLEPAGIAVMQGFGAGVKKGATDVMKMMSDYTNDIGGLKLAGSTGGINFGPGAIRLTFAGALPTDAQAMDVGRAVGSGINDRLAERDTALAVRTL